jgi:hypothetical protein
VFLPWKVEICDEFLREFQRWPDAIQDALIAQSQVLGRFGPELGRPYVDTLNGSRHANMKELRCGADSRTWRIAFAFDPRREAILLVGGSKSGVSEGRFYKALIKLADARFDRHLADLKEDKT